MNKYTRSFAMAAATALLLVGCGSSDKDSSDAALDDDLTGIADSADAPTGKDPASVDVCALLSESDANDVARTRGLDGAQTASTTYKLTATKEESTGVFPTSGCKFTITGPGASGTISFQVKSASGFSIYSSGTKIDGLGDEAYSNQGSAVVRVGDLMISPGENSFTNDFATDLLRKMVPKMK